MRHPPDLFGSSPRGACSSVALPGDNSSREGSLCCSSRHKKPNGELTGDVATSRQLHLRLCGRRCCSHTDESCRRFPTLVTLVITPSLVRFVFLIRFVTLVTLRRLTLVRRLVTFVATRHSLSLGWTWTGCLGSFPGRGLWRGALCRWLYGWVLSKNRLFLTFFVVVRRLFSRRRSCSVRRRSRSRSSFSWD